MKTRNSTKSKLLSSVIALVLCVSMLIGATFAWFTDTASTGVNKIQAGNLDIALEMKDNSGKWVNAEGKTLQFKVGGSIPADGTQILWEPGCTYELPELRIRNNGNLKLKYQIAISGIQGDAELNNAIEWTINDTELGSNHPLEPGASDTLTIKGHMKETAGNEYQGKSIDNIAITVRAAQLGGTYGTVSGEFDSAGNDYDATAPYCEWPVVVNQAVAKDPSGNPTGQTLTKYVSADVQAQVEIPAEAVDPNAAQMILKVEKSTAPGNFTIAAGQDSKTYEVKVEGLKENNDTPVKAKIFVGIGLTNVTLTHNGNEAFTDVGAAASFTGTDKTFYYDSDDGYIYFASKTFSPFSAAFDAPVGISGEGTMKETYYPTAEKAQEAADNGTEVTAIQKVDNVQVGNKTESVEKGETFKIPAAEYKGTKYYSVAEAVTARGTSGSVNTITILNNITENIVLKGYTKLELNGKTVTGNISMEDYDSIQNGTVNGTVTDLTKAAPSNTDKNGVYNCTVTKFVLADGCNRENVVIENSTIGEVAVGNRYYSSGSAGLLTFKDSHVTGNITVGTANNPDPGDWRPYPSGSKVRFLGGTYDGTITLFDPNNYNNVIEIVTGTFASYVSAFLNGGSAIREEDGKYIAYKLPVAQVGETTYETIEAACEAAMAGENHTVTVLCDGNVETTVNVTGTLVFDLNGHTVQAAPPNNRAFYIQENGHLTINDSSEGKTGLLESLSSSNAETIYFKGGNSSLTVNGGTIKSPGNSIASQNIQQPFSITINGGKVWSTDNIPIRLGTEAPITFLMTGGTIACDVSYRDPISVGSSYTYKGDGHHTFTFTGGTLSRKGSYDVCISSGSKIPTTVNIASGMTVKCNTGSGITVNENYSAE